MTESSVGFDVRFAARMRGRSGRLVGELLLGGGNWPRPGIGRETVRIVLNDDESDGRDACTPPAVAGRTNERLGVEA